MSTEQFLTQVGVTKVAPGIARGITLSAQARDSHIKRRREFAQR